MLKNAHYLNSHNITCMHGDELLTISLLSCEIKLYFMKMLIA